MKSLDIVNERLQQFEDITWKIDSISVAKKDLQTIKQDLEVLEILRKQSKFEFNGLSVEDYAKLKQWLEENEE